MPINAVFGTNKANSNLAAPFNPAWSKIESLDWGIDRPVSTSVKTGSISLAVGELKGLTLTRYMDGTSTALARAAIAGTNIGNTMIAVTDGSSNKTVVAFKLMNALVVRYLIGTDGSMGAGGGMETIILWYPQIAMAVLTAGAVTTMGWDLATNAQWSFPAATFTLDATYGIKIA
jgi:type VI protein secretion system component Hcp